MLPSPSRFLCHDPSQPITPQIFRHPVPPSNQQKHNLPFIAPPSRLVFHSCSTTPKSKPLTTLLLSYTLAQKIHQLLLASRQIELLARQLFSGEAAEQDVARHMSELEEKYDMLREDVESELETAWVRAGFLPEALPTYHSSTKAARKTQNKQQVDHDTVDRELKRKRQAGTEEDEGNGKKKRYKWERQEGKGESSREQGDWEYFSCLAEPIGITRGMIPLSDMEVRRMFEWSWREMGNRKRENMESKDVECISPRGTVFCH